MMKVRQGQQARTADRIIPDSWVAVWRLTSSRCPFEDIHLFEEELFENRDLG
jgi:hypothetical protein